MSADGSIVIDTNIDDKNAQKELSRLNRQIKSLEEQLATKRQGRLPLENSLNSVNARLEEARNRLAMLQDEQNAINATMQPGSSAYDFMRAYEDAPRVQAALKQQQAEVDAIEKEWKQADKALSNYDAKISALEGKLNRAKEDAGEFQQNMAAAGASSNAMNRAVSRMEDSINKFSHRVIGLVKRAFVFTLISRALSSLRTWFGKIIKSNSEAVAAIARLKGSLLTLAQPLIEVIIPAFTKFVDMLARIIAMAARFTAALFGTTADKAADSAQKLRDETEAIEETGNAAKDAEKSLAAFDEINQLSDGSKDENKSDESTIEPDFSLVKNNIQDAISAILELLTGAALLAIGAILVFTGASIPLGLALMVMGALAIADAITSNPDAIKELLQNGLGAALTIIGPLIAVIGVLLVVTGHILLGIALIILGAAIWAVGAASGDEGDFVQNILTRLAEAATVIGPLIAVLGVFLVITGHILLGLAFIIAGAALWAVGKAAGDEGDFVENIKTRLSEAAVVIGPLIAVLGVLLVVMGQITQGVAFIILGAAIWATGKAAGDEGDFVQNILTRLQEAAAVVGPLIAIIGIVLLVAGKILIGIGLIIAGIAIWTFSETDLDSGEGIGNAIVSALMSIFAKIGPYIALIGVVLLLTPLPGFRGIGIGMIVAGIAMFAVGEIGMNWETLSTDLVTGLLNILNDISPYIAILGLILMTAGMIPIGLGLLVAGIAIFAVTTALSPDFTTWSDWGKNIVDSFLSGLKSAWEGVVSWAKKAIDWLKDLFGGASKSANISTSGVSASSGNSRISAPRLALEDVPALARGAVIPPNKEFLAVLGDQKSGTNIEAPTSEIEAAVARGIQRSGMNGGSGDHTVILQIGEQEMGRLVYRLNQQQTQRIGVRLAEG